ESSAVRRLAGPRVPGFALGCPRVVLSGGPWNEELAGPSGFPAAAPAAGLPALAQPTRRPRRVRRPLRLAADRLLRQFRAPFDPEAQAVFPLHLAGDRLVLAPPDLGASQDLPGPDHFAGAAKSDHARAEQSHASHSDGRGH